MPKILNFAKNHKIFRLKTEIFDQKIVIFLQKFRFQAIFFKNLNFRPIFLFGKNCDFFSKIKKFIGKNFDF